MRTKKAILNILGAFSLQFVANLTGLIIPGLVISAYGSVVNGLISSIRQFLRYLSLLESGLSGATIVELYKPLAERDDGRVSEILSSSRYYYNQVGSLFLFGAVVLAAVYPSLVDCAGVPYLHVSALVLLLGVSGALSFFLVSSHRALLTADQRSGVLSFIGALVGVGGLVATASLIVLGYGFFVLPLVSVASVLLTAMAVSRYCHIVYSSRFRFDLPENNEVIPKRKSVLVSQFAQMTESSAPIVMTTLILGLAEVSVFAVYNMVFYSLESIVKTLPRSLQSSFGEVMAASGGEKTRSVFAEYEFLYLAILGWVYTTASILIVPFISVYTHGVTDANYERPLLGGLFIAVAVLQQVKQPSATVIYGAGKFREVNRNAIESVLLGVGSGVVGAFCLGLTGVMLGGVLSSLYRTAYMIYYCHRMLLMRSLGCFFIALLRNVMLSVACWSPFLFWIQLEPTTVIGWLCWGVLVALWAGGVFVLGSIVFERRMASVLFTRMLVLIQS